VILNLSNNISLSRFSLFFLNVISIISYSSYLKEINNIQKFQAINLLLKDTGIDPPKRELSILVLSGLLTLFLFVSLILGFYLSIKANFLFFAIGVSSILFGFLSFYKKINLFNRYFGSIITSLFFGFGLFIAGLSHNNFTITSEHLLIGLVLTIGLLISETVIEICDRNINLRDDKRTFSTKYDYKKNRKILSNLFTLIYLLQIGLVVYTGNILYFISLFSGTVGLQILIQIYSERVERYNQLKILGIIFFYFHSILLIFPIIKF
jgi:1,4-dihydroxy-2-naphthoate octaprenyltransferase